MTPGRVGVKGKGQRSRASKKDQQSTWGALWKARSTLTPPFNAPPLPPPGPRVTTWRLVLIGDKAADKMGLSGPQVGHQLVEVLLGVGRGEEAHRAGRQNWKPQWVSPLRAGGQAPPRASTHLSPFSVALCPFLLDWVPITTVFTPHPVPLRPRLHSHPHPKPCPGSAGTGSSTDLL